MAKSRKPKQYSYNRSNQNKRRKVLENTQALVKKLLAKV